MGKNLLKVESIDVFYGDAQALWNVSFRVDQGSIVALIGANGAGKSTALNTISGFNLPDKGTILYEGKSLCHQPPEQIVNTGVSHVPEGRRLFNRLTVLENLELGAFSSMSARKRMKQSLEEVFVLFPKLRDRKNQTAGTLSGGEQQILAIGRALMARPKLLMLDEPSLGLAPQIVELMFDIIIQLRDKGITILLVEQNVYQTLRISDYAYVLQTGHLKMEGRGDVLLADPDFQKTFLGMVY